jgi:hypothetical protein
MQQVNVHGWAFWPNGSACRAPESSSSGIAFRPFPSVIRRYGQIANFRPLHKISGDFGVRIHGVQVDPSSNLGVPRGDFSYGGRR